mmetsp:Transcript_75895/g.217264  ORF Transcript_75895/g.217264 Transcript_75895/m.217264 type:complete len:579 (-) Transcript_75895:69-1805(-)
MATPPGGQGQGGQGLFNLLASMQSVENLRAQNAANAQSLQEQLQVLSATQQARDLLDRQRLALAQAIAQTQQQLAQQSQTSSAKQGQHLPPPLTPGPQGHSASTSRTSSPLPVQVGPPLGMHSGGASSSAAGAAAAPKRDAPQVETKKTDAEPEEEVPRCHLHRKQNKACKFCKAYYQNEEERQQKLAQERIAALEKWKEGSVNHSGKGLGPEDKAPLPNFPNFPTVWSDRIQKNDYFLNTLSNMTIGEVKGIIAQAEACDTEWRAEKTLDLEPSAFMSCIYRLLQTQLNEGELKGLLKNRSPFVRCAGFIYIRMGMHHERYWELLSDALMDNEEFNPFPSRGSETMSVGQYAEQLLTKDKYVDLPLPRIPVAQRKAINKRMVLYGQFRKRYAANLEVLDRFKETGVKVEICTLDGEWLTGETSESPSKGQCKTLKVAMADGEEQDVSLGMLITPSASGNSTDLTRSRGRSAEELLEKFESQQRDAALATGKDYCKTSGQHTLRVGGVPFVAGVKRKDMDSVRPLETEEEARQARRNMPSMEHQAKLAAIESKYCARVGSGAGSRSSNLDGPERMRLG